MAKNINTVTIINDCRDTNAAARQIARLSSILNCSAILVGVTTDLEAAGNLIDALDATEGRPGVILVNVAPRNGEAKKWPNGTPFGYFHYKDTLVISTIDGLTLSLVKKLKLVNQIKVLDIPIVLDELTKGGLLSEKLNDYIVNSQFRSFEFLPRVAFYLLKNHDVVASNLKISQIADIPNAVWWIDSFGNCKTTILPEEVSFGAGGSLKTKIGEINFYPRLKDVPDNTPGIIIGSSGLLLQRFLEIVIQGQSAAKRLQLAKGDLII